MPEWHFEFYSDCELKDPVGRYKGLLRLTFRKILLLAVLVLLDPTLQIVLEMDTVRMDCLTQPVHPESKRPYLDLEIEFIEEM